MKKTDEFGNRMKTYEFAFRSYLPKRLPVLLRIDGCHFHSYTKKLEKPFDERLVQTFWKTGKFLASEIMGCKLVYHQSDEISLLLTNNDKLTTEAWFDNNLQKITSVAASLTTAKFNDEIKKILADQNLATFDCRAWILPPEEVVNYFLWRQQDAIKNSVSMVAQSHFSAKQLHGLSGKQMQEKLMVEKEINWNDLPIWQKRGVCITKQSYQKDNAIRHRWVVDKEIPIFSQDRGYIEQYVYPKDK
ncbi:tRNA(His) guanylyltransferase Thg1 family protein [Shimazuella sp. AN120528]|uniref:tRNA(His) guanylyltransferase Thg1 family protein n=1 Tax=Shimazuella soli TaxID=1892854 RepID=UPI001F106607|nr:tRNA(His) guanylyltransferase Thg1 family protein [Shimazuella soli]MCH5584809.1 tRNA(His) guanylyltransferase Thg1 family protein [Shimazuella soli]